jgi:hypothetical protein
VHSYLPRIVKPSLLIALPLIIGISFIIIPRYSSLAEAASIFLTYTGLILLVWTIFAFVFLHRIIFLMRKVDAGAGGLKLNSEFIKWEDIL